MNIVVLTNAGSLFGKKVLNALHHRGVVVGAAVVIAQPMSQYWKLFRLVQRRVGVMQAAYFSARRVLFPSPTPTMWEGRPFIDDYSQLAGAVHRCRGTNSAETVALLAAIVPDLLILGQTGIVHKRVLALPRLGTLNAHPGILPNYRGIDSALWAIHNGDWDKIGNTVHWVDAGVDTGPIIARRSFAIDRPLSPAQLADALYDEGAMLMADSVQQIATGASVRGETQPPGVQYYKMPLGIERSVRRCLHSPPWR
jgi:methionyl-tRNA formyltransferase